MDRRFTGDELKDAYGHLTARRPTERQEQVDVAEDGGDHNVIESNPVGCAEFVNPNLDAAYLDAWIARDQGRIRHG